MIHHCIQCGVEFTATRQNHPVCQACKDANSAAVCVHCGQIFARARQTQSYCSQRCRLAAMQSRGTAAQAQARRIQGRIEVRCIWPHCPTPELLISVRRSQGERHYHPDCYQGHLKAGAGLRNRYVVNCAHCGKKLERTASRVASVAHSFCSKDHAFAWQRAARPSVRCVQCGTTTVAAPSQTKRYPTVDQETMTWTCPACRHDKAVAARSSVCTHCGVSFTAWHAKPGIPRFCCRAHFFVWRAAHRPPKAIVRIVCAYCQIEAESGLRDSQDVTFTMPRCRVKRSRLHFCSKRHRALYVHEKRRRTSVCQHCGSIIQRKAHYPAFCDRTCYSAFRRGRERITWRVTDAERRLQAAWVAGVRGVRPLARESGASVNTVQKLLKAGKLVDPAPALTGVA